MRTRQHTWKERWAVLQTNGGRGDCCRWQALLEAAAIAGLQFAAAPAAAPAAAAVMPAAPAAVAPATAAPEYIDV
jgi:hypothetical protein